MHVALGRSPHDHGHRVDDGFHGRGAGAGVADHAAIPAVDSRRYVLAHMSSRRVVDMVKEDLKMSKILTKPAFESGTAYGTVVLHTSPEAAAGGPLALVKNGDMIELYVEKRRLHLDVSDAELEKPRKAWQAPPPHDVRGYVKLYCDTVNQAHQGCDLEFLVGKSGAAVPRESH